MLLVTGSGRSGTSAVAQLLHRAGTSVGRDLIEPDESNAEGYFEERAVISLNDAILREAGLLERFSTASRADVLAVARSHHDEMRALVAEATPAWKDPRFCWTLEAWLEALPEKPRVIVCLRSPVEVAASTMRYFGLAGAKDARAVEHVWRSQYVRLIEIIEDHALDAMCVEYARLHADPATTVREVAEFMGAPLDPESIRQDLRHHEADVPVALRELYGRVRSLKRRAAAKRQHRASGGARGASAPSRS
jgi:hypothetical protein